MDQARVDETFGCTLMHALSCSLYTIIPEDKTSFLLFKPLFSLVQDTNKQLLDEVEHDIMNYQSRGLCYLPKPKAETDNTDTRV